jgi:hypothetical protein
MKIVGGILVGACSSSRIFLAALAEAGVFGW